MRSSRRGKPVMPKCKIEQLAILATTPDSSVSYISAMRVANSSILAIMFACIAADAKCGSEL